MAVDQRDAAGKLADFGQKLPRPLIDHGRDMAQAVALGDRDMAGEHHEHAGTGLAGLEQSLAVAIRPELAEPAHPRDFGRCQRGKGLLETRENPSRTHARRACRSVLCGHPRLSPCNKQMMLQRRSSPRRVRNIPASRKLAICPAFLRPPDVVRLRRPARAAAVILSRSLACDFRRLRFSRSASLSRSCLEPFARAALCPSRLSF